MPESLVKGQRINLLKYLSDLKFLKVDIICELNSSYSLYGSNINISTFCLNENDKFLNESYLINSNNIKTPCNSINYYNSKNHENTFSFIIDFSRIKKSIKKIIFVLSMGDGLFDNPEYSKIFKNFEVRLSGLNNETFLRFQVPFEFSGEPTVEFFEIYFKDFQWKVAAISMGYIGGLSLLTEKYGLIVEELNIKLNEKVKEDENDEKNSDSNHIINEPLDKKLKVYRDKLLDLSKRNPLINIRSKSVIEFSEPDIYDIFEKLFDNNETLSITTIHENQEFYPIEKNEVRINRNKKDATNILSRIRRRANSALEEQGVNILYMAIGKITWSEIESSNDRFLSPILLLPVELYKISINTPYKLRILEEEIIINPALNVKMINQFAVGLPELPEENDVNSLRMYFSKIREELKDIPNQKIDETGCLGIFSFNKLVLYNDLEKYNNLIKSHHIINGQISIQSKNENFSEIMAEKLDEIVSSKNNFQVLDADSSQQEAILLAKKGASFVLQGPPGTGKSQTITNIIAECISDGKSVLFVSEKMAALEVVKKRLENCGMGDFCLELHGQKVVKKNIVLELDKTLQLSKKVIKQDVIEELNKLDKIKKHLNSYVQLLHKPQGELKLSTFHVQAYMASLNKFKILMFSIPNILEITYSQWEEMKENVKILSGLTSVFTEFEKHPWKNTVLKTISLENEIIIRNIIDNIINSLNFIDQKLERYNSELNLNRPENINQINIWIENNSFILSTPFPLLKWIDDSFDLEVFIEKIKNIEKQVLDYKKKKSSLLENYTQSFLNKEILKNFSDNLSVILKKYNTNQFDLYVNFQKEINNTLDNLKNNFENLKVLNEKIEIYTGVIPPINNLDLNKLENLLNLIILEPKAQKSWYDKEKIKNLIIKTEQMQKMIDQKNMIFDKFTNKYNKELINKLPEFNEQFKKLYNIFSNNLPEHFISKKKEIEEIFISLNYNFEKLEKSVDSISSLCGLSKPKNFFEFENYQELLENIIKEPQVQESWFNQAKIENIISQANELENKTNIFNNNFSIFTSKYKSEIISHLPELNKKFIVLNDFISKKFDTNFINEENIIKNSLTGAKTNLENIIKLIDNISDITALEKTNTFIEYEHLKSLFEILLQEPEVQESWFNQDNIENIISQANELENKTNIFNNNFSIFTSKYKSEIISHLPELNKKFIVLNDFISKKFDTNFINEENIIKNSLTGAKTNLENIIKLIDNISDITALEKTNTFIEYEHLKSLFEILLQEPEVQESWYDEKILSTLLLKIEETSQKSENYKQKYQDFINKYNKDILDLDIEKLINRFEGEFKSAFKRFFDPVYKSDFKQITKLENNSKLKYADILDILKAAELVNRERKWFSENRNEFIRNFGDNYIGENTNWDKIKKDVLLTKKIIKWFSALDIPQKLKKILKNGGIDLIKLKQNFEELEENLGNLKNFLVNLKTHNIDLEIEKGFKNALNILIDYKLTLDNFWSLNNTLKQFSIENKINWLELKNDLRLGFEILEFRNYCTENNEQLTLYFGTFFKSEKTDWSKIKKDVLLMKKIIKWFSALDIPQKLKKILKNGGIDLIKLKQNFEELEENLGNLKNFLVNLKTHNIDLEIEKGFKNALNILIDYKLTLDNFWSLNNTLKQFSIENKINWLELKNDLRLGFEILEFRNYCTENNEQLTLYFGTFFKSEKTDWLRIKNDLITINNILNWFPNKFVTNELKNILKNQSLDLKMIKQFYYDYIDSSAKLKNYLDRFNKANIIIDYQNINKTINNIHNDVLLKRENFNTLWTFYSKIEFHLKENNIITWNQLNDDFKAGFELIDFENYFLENKEELKNDFGICFIGSETNWTFVNEQLQITEKILIWFSNQVIPEKLKELIKQPDEILKLKQLYDDLRFLKNTIDKDFEFLNSHKIFIIFNGLNTDFEIIKQQVINEKIILNNLWNLDLNLPEYLRININNIDWNNLKNDFSKGLEILEFENYFNEQYKEKLEKELDYHFKGINTNWSKILETLEWSGKFRQTFTKDESREIYKDFNKIKSLVTNNNQLFNSFKDISENIKTESNNLSKQLNHFKKFFINEKIEINKLSIWAISFNEINKWVLELKNNFNYLNEWIKFKMVESYFESKNMKSFTDLLFEEKIFSTEIDSIFKKRFYQLWLNEIYTKVLLLNDFKGVEYNDLISEFAKLDNKSLAIARARLQVNLRDNLPEQDMFKMESSVFGILNQEITKKKKHKPLRKLFVEIKEILFNIKPCFMMSPLSVSQFIDPEKLKFNVVVFDEASQIFPEDAIGAIIRAEQLIVVGDKKQMPPSNFFRFVDSDDSDEYDEEDLPEYESILDECSNMGLPTKMLQWHYRSKDEHLIAFSNKHFYNNKLFTFPNKALDNTAIEFIHVNGTYDMGGSRQNRVEAEKIADLVFEHFRNHYNNISLGVITFSETQQMAIISELEKRRMEDQSFESLFESKDSEKFFVKSLEHVQGDERDIIFFSVGYGKNQNNKLSYNFGPIIKTGGERRLNVAITRAKQHIKLVSSIRYSDIDLSRINSIGGKLLRNYLEYAELGKVAIYADQKVTEHLEFDSPFEEHVYEEITNLGYTVRSQVGSSGYKIDLAIVDPENPGEFLLAIECDGATYHSSKTARDRDRLRQQVLESLGWRIHRIWSRDWVSNQTYELKKIKEEIEKAKKNRKQVIDFKTKTNNIDSLLSDVEETVHWDNSKVKENKFIKESNLKKYNSYSIYYIGEPNEFHNENNNNKISSLIYKIVHHSSPTHLSVLTKKVAESWKLNKVSSKIQHKVNNLIKTHSHIYLDEDEFVWIEGMNKAEIKLPGEHRDVTEICKEEFIEATLFCLRDSIYAEREELIKVVANLYGFVRVTSAIKDRLNQVINLYMLKGYFIEENNIIKIKQ